MMISGKKLISLVAFLLILSLGTTAYGQESKDKQKILIDIPSRTLQLIENDEIVKEYPVAVGKANSQTPIGEYKVVNKLVNPYYSKLRIPGGSPNNPLGTRWIGFRTSYGIHGNSNPSSIGTLASAGCVRMYERDVQELYEKVKHNTPVIIKYEPIKILKDIRDENPIILAYPDYYKKEKDYTGLLDKKLNETGLDSIISKERQGTLKKMAVKDRTIITDTWTFFINDRYITKGIQMVENKAYIDKSYIEEFFNTQIYTIDDEGKALILGHDIEELDINDTRYISIEDMTNILGGKYEINKEMQTLNYSLSYVILNGKLVRGEAIDLSKEAKIPVSTITNIYNVKTLSKDKSFNLLYNGKNIKYENLNNIPYAKAKDLNPLDIKSNIYTKGNYVELFVKPVVIYTDKIYTAEIVDGKIYVPLKLVDDIDDAMWSNKENDEIDKPVFNVSDNEIKEINKIKHIKMEELEKFFFINSDPYNTLFFIEERII